MRSIVKVRSWATLRIHFGARMSLFDYRAGKLSNQISPQMTLASLVGQIREKTH